jgi:primosomal protein N' (replication factor Y) (superfamily II helicase)
VTNTGRLFDPDLSVALDKSVVRVLPDVSGLDREFDYRAGPDHPVAVGSLVRVELQHRMVAGWVTALGSEAPAGIELHPIARVSSVGPSADLVDLARWAAIRWSGRLAPVLRAASPPRMVASLPAPVGRTGPSRPTPPPSEEWATGVTVVRQSPNDDALGWLIPLAARGSVLVVTPRVDTARHLGGRLRERGFTVRVHPREWAAAAGRGGVVIGARSAVWARVAELAAIVVLDEHDESLQEERNPTWHARDVAIERARRAGIPCVLLSPCPSLAALALADRSIEPSRTSERAGWPVVEVVDRRGDEPGRGGLFSARTAQVVRGQGTVLAVLNRKGRAVMLSCATCGELARTEDGERLMVEQDGRLRCLATGETRPLVCASCAGTSLKRLRLGVTRAAEELAALAGEPVSELTAGTSPQRPPTRVVVGTEAALHQLAAVDTVIFLDFDQDLLAPRFRAAEQAMGLLVLAARLVGPRAAPGQPTGGGRLLIQTRTPQHRVVRAAVRADPGWLAAEEEKLRRPMGFPPYGALAEISGPGAEGLVAGLLEQPELTVMGPRPDGRYLVRADGPETLAELLRPDRRPSGRVRVAVDPPRA